MYVHLTNFGEDDLVAEIGFVLYGFRGSVEGRRVLAHDDLTSTSRRVVLPLNVF